MARRCKRPCAGGGARHATRDVSSSPSRPAPPPPPPHAPPPPPAAFTSLEKPPQHTHTPGPRPRQVHGPAALAVLPGVQRPAGAGHGRKRHRGAAHLCVEPGGPAAALQRAGHGRGTAAATHASQPLCPCLSRPRTQTARLIPRTSCAGPYAWFRAIRGWPSCRAARLTDPPRPLPCHAPPPLLPRWSWSTSSRCASGP